LNNDQADSNWLSKYISLDESTTNIMFPDQYLTGQFIDDQAKTHPQTTSPIFISSSSHQSNPDSFLNLLSVSIDDEHSISSSSNSSQRRRLFSSLEVKSLPQKKNLEFIFQCFHLE
jgi:hypothetical protein